MTATEFEEMFGTSDEDDRTPTTEITNPADLHMLRTIDENRALIARLDDDNRGITDYLAEHYAGQKRLVWRDSQGNIRPFRLNPPQRTYEPGPQGLNWLRIQYPHVFDQVTKRVLDGRVYRKLRASGVITDDMHEAMLPRDDDGNPIPARERRASVVLPAAKTEEEPSATS